MGKRWHHFLFSQISLQSHVTLADSGGGPWAPRPPLTPRFEGPSYTVWRPHCKFKSKIMNFGALIYYFFKKISSLALLGMNLIFFSNSSGLTLLIISSSYVYIILCAYFYIILAQAITFSCL